VAAQPARQTAGADRQLIGAQRGERTGRVPRAAWARDGTALAEA
jgi:hypothetical protein